MTLNPKKKVLDSKHFSDASKKRWAMEKTRKVEKLAGSIDKLLTKTKEEKLSQIETAEKVAKFIVNKKK